MSTIRKRRAFLERPGTFYFRNAKKLKSLDVRPKVMIIELMATLLFLAVVSHEGRIRRDWPQHMPLQPGLQRHRII